MKKEMTSRERILSAIRRQETDYVPCAPFMNPQDRVERRGKLWQYPFGPSMQETTDYMVGTMGVDQVLHLSWGYYKSKEVSEEVWLEGDILHKKIITPSGTLHAAVKATEHWPHGFDIPLVSDYMPAHGVEQWIKTGDDVECLRHIMLPPTSKSDLDALRFQYREMKQLADTYDLAVAFYFGYGLTGGVLTFGPTDICINAVDNPEIVDRYLEIDHECNIKNYEIALDMGVDIVRRNGFYESCDLFSPSILNEMIYPRLKEEAKIVHEGGKVFGYTILSGITPLFDSLSKVGIDCLICPDIFLRNEDVNAMNKKLRDKMCFWTGPSDTVHMPVDNPEEVRKAVRRIFEAFGKRGLIITPCSSSKAVFPWGNVEAMIDEWKKLR